QPWAGSQASSVHGLPSLQASGVPAAQVPAWQVSAPLQALPSLHDVPSATAACWQPASGSQWSEVHGLPSSHLGALPGAQVPARQVSAPLQASPSLHDVPSATGVEVQ